MISDRLHALLNERIARGEFCARMPALVDASSAPREPVISAELRDRRARVEAMVTSDDLDGATAHIQSAYDANVQIEPGLYEHDILLRPLLDIFANGECSMAEMTMNAERAGYWLRDAPENPFSAALFALSLQQLGSAHSGTNWLDPDADDTDAVLEQCIHHAAQTLDDAAGVHHDHWFWRFASLRLATHDHRGAKDHWARFERAVEAQPLSSKIWTTFAAQLSHHCDGEAEDLERLGKRAWMATRRTKSPWLYLDVLTAIKASDRDLVLLDEVASNLIETFAESSRDAERTLAVSAFAARGDYGEAVKLMSRMTSLHTENWLVREDPRWVMGMAEIHAPMNVLAA